MSGSRPDPAPAPADAIAVDGARLCCLRRGDPAAPLVLCLHGFPDHASSFAPVLDRLADAGYLAVAPWMRGYAPSTTSGPYHAAQLGRDVIALADALTSTGGSGGPGGSAALGGAAGPGRAPPVYLVGHDWGAVAAYAAMALDPGRFGAAVAMSVPHPLHWAPALRRRPAQIVRSSYMVMFQLPRLPERALAWRDHALIDWLWRVWSPGYRLPAADRAALLGCLDASMPAPLEYYRAIARPPRQALARLRELAPALRGLRVPTLYLHGAADGCVRPEFARGQERLFAARFAAQVVPDAGHFLHLEQPDVVARRAIAWFDHHRADPGGDDRQRRSISSAPNPPSGMPT